MMFPRQPTNTKVCPGCGTRLINTARRCLVCGYLYTDEEMEAAAQPQEHEPRPKGFRSAQQFRSTRLPYYEVPPRSGMKVTVSLPLLLLGILMLLAVNTIAILGWSQRAATSTQVAGERATGTYIATMYVSPTPTITPTRTPPPPTFTVIPEIKYKVVAGDSCLAVANRFKISLQELQFENKNLDCANLSIGTELIIPNPTPTPTLEPPTKTPAP